jgi:hypothetical protein
MRTLPAAGRAAVAGGMLFILAAVAQFRFDLFDRDAGGAYLAHQAVALTAVALFVLALWWLGRARVAGDGPYARTVLGLFTAGWALILVGGLLNLAGGAMADVGVILPAIGGGLNTLTGLLAGSAVVRARRLPGWRRWSLLAYALYYSGALSLPVMVSGQEPTLVTEVGWGLAWLGVGAAALTAPSATGDESLDDGLAHRTARSVP